MDPNQQRAGPWQQTSSFKLSGFLPFIAIVSAMVLMIFSSISSSFKNSISILHQVPEGHIGVYLRGGALLKSTTEPGFQVKMPFITQYDSIPVTLQTDVVPDITCVTKGGVEINFKKIQVVCQLQKEYVHKTLLKYGVHYKKTWIHDKIQHHIIQFCASHSLQEVYIDKSVQIEQGIKEALQFDCTRYAPGIEIINLHVTKPDIPDSIRRNFKQLEEEHIKMLIAVEKQKVQQKVAKKEAETSKILMEQALLEKEVSRRLQEIENQMHLQREKSRADANFYLATKEAEANRLKFTEYLKLKCIEAIVEIAKRFSDFVKLLQYLQLFARYFFH